MTSHFVRTESKVCAPVCQVEDRVLSQQLRPRREDTTIGSSSGNFPFNLGAHMGALHAAAVTQPGRVGARILERNACNGESPPVLNGTRGTSRVPHRFFPPGPVPMIRGLQKERPASPLYPVELDAAQLRPGMWGVPRLFSGGQLVQPDHIFRERDLELADQERRDGYLVLGRYVQSRSHTFLLGANHGFTCKNQEESRRSSPQAYSWDGDGAFPPPFQRQGKTQSFAPRSFGRQKVRPRRHHFTALTSQGMSRSGDQPAAAIGDVGDDRQLHTDNTALYRQRREASLAHGGGALAWRQRI